MLNILVGDSKCLMSLMSKAYALAISSLASSWPITPNCKIPATTIPYGPCTVCDDRRVPWKQTLHASLRPMRTSEKTFRERGRQKLRARERRGGRVAVQLRLRLPCLPVWTLLD